MTYTLSARTVEKGRDECTWVVWLIPASVVQGGLDHPVSNYGVMLASITAVDATDALLASTELAGGARMPGSPAPDVIFC